MVRFALYYDKDKEEKFLNEMSGKGYAMTGFCMGFYHFDKCPPGEYIYQIDITEGLFRVSNDYREFMQEMGVEIVCLWGPWVILRKRAREGSFVLYTDVESSIEHYTQIRKTFKICGVIESICLFAEVIGVARGSLAACIGSLLLAGILLTIIRQIARIDGILAQLKERAGMDNDTDTGRSVFGRSPSRALIAGLLLNNIAFWISEPETDTWLNYYLGFLKGFCHVIAIALIAAGIVHTFRRGHRE